MMKEGSKVLLLFSFHLKNCLLILLPTLDGE